MATKQDIETWMAETRESRRMIELFGDEDIEMTEPGSAQGESHSAKSYKSVLTNRSSCRDPTPTRIKFLQEYPALMDPLNFLQLIVRFPPGDILTWANAERSVSLFNSTQLGYLRGNVIDLMSEIIPGGLRMLQQCMEIAKDHHRLGLPQNKWNTNGPTLRLKSIDEWYWRVSEITTTDSVQLPFSYSYTATQREVLKWSLGGNYQMLLSTLLRGLLRDPLIPHLSLQEIPDNVLIDMCTRYSYLHISDALKLNSPNMQLTAGDIKTRVDDLVFASPRLYFKQQKACGHLNESWREVHSSDRKIARELRIELYALLHRCSSPAVEARISGLPRRTLDEGKLPSLIKDICNPGNLMQRERAQYSEILTRVLGKQVNDDGDESMEDLETFIVDVCSKLAK